MDKTILFCLIGIAGLGFTVFVDAQIISLKMEHKAISIGRMAFSVIGILVLAIIMIGRVKSI